MGEEVVRLEQASKHYDTEAGSLPVLHDVDLVLESGDLVAITGPSGSGKSTLMNVLGCLDTLSSGRYLLRGEDTGALDGDALARLRNRYLGFVFQGFNLLPRQSLLDNVALPMLYAGVTRHARERRAEELLLRVGLSGLAQRRPTQISGGQQQRVAVARALANQPRLLLADEPTGNLDSHTSEQIMALFLDLNAAEGITVVVVTHDERVAGYCRRRVQMVDGRVAPAPTGPA